MKLGNQGSKGEILALIIKLVAVFDSCEKTDSFYVDVVINGREPVFLLTLLR